VIRWASLATSILIALPAILPAISMGLIFFGSLMGNNALIFDAANAIGSLGATGATSAMTGALGVAGITALHALTCALPLGVTSLFLGKTDEQAAPMPKLVLPALNSGRITPLQVGRLATA
jgi:hypothetical protein